MDNPFKKMLDWLNNQQSNRKLTKSNYLIILACIGIILLIISQWFTSSNQTEVGDGNQSAVLDEEKTETFANKDVNDPLFDLEQAYQSDLSEMLEKIAGISEVEVMVNLEATGEKVYEKNLIVGTQTTVESDQGGGTRNIDDLTEEQQVVIIRQGDTEVPLIVQSKKPEVRGVLVVADGVEQIQLKQWATEAVSRVLDVAPHRVSIMPRSKGEG
ncbi:stage III sporulation protein AG [Amphibacillus sp. Q70]|uniref:stage III sporulation protein AG n=1 Tax=Amphibacillus sp. Q70 TaxID=3453416 RepID=UPI003F82E668